MIKQHRHSRILSILRRDGVIDLGELARLMPEVSKVTLRRDLADLADAGALRRTHGGAVLPDADLVGNAPPAGNGESEELDELENLDAIILPPIPGRGGDALRRKVARSGVPFIAESAPQEGGTYLGPDNRAAGYELGLHAGRETPGQQAHVLIVGHPDLTNTQERADGFEAGFRTAFGGVVNVTRVNGQGSYRPALRVALDALRTNEAIAVAFGVNDHSAIAAIDAGADVMRPLAVYATGGESAEFVARLRDGGPLRAVSAFFPEVVGARAIDLAMECLAGGAPGAAVRTPHEIVTAANADDYYEPCETGWRLIPSRAEALIGENERRPGALRTGRIGFMPHFPAHDWYRVLIQAMRTRAAEFGIELVVSPPHKGIAAEMSRLRRQIAGIAVERLAPGETIILGEGEATGYLAEELRRVCFEKPTRLSDVTVITNSLDVLFTLDDAPHLKVILTSGEYQQADRCLVGPSLGALFDRMRADTAFLSVAGVSPEFGISAVDERRALAGSRFVDAARRVVALADNAAMGTDANHRIAPTRDVDEVITDDGALPADRQKLRIAGVDVLIAGEAGDDTPHQSAPRTQMARQA